MVRRRLALVALVLLVAGGLRPAVAADCSAFTNGCDPSAQCHVMARTGLCYPDPCYCPYETPVNAFMQYMNDHAVFDNAGTAVFIFPDVTASDDNYEFFLRASSNTTTLVSVGCHCEVNCGTPATLAFSDRGGNAISLTGGGDLACGTGSGATTATTFDTSDADRVLASGEGARLSVTNSPTASQRITITMGYITP